MSIHIRVRLRGRIWKEAKIVALLDWLAVPSQGDLMLIVVDGKELVVRVENRTWQPGVLYNPNLPASTPVVTLNVTRHKSQRLPWRGSHE